MSSLLLVHESFERTWPFAADHWHRRWQDQGEVVFVRSTEPNPTVRALLSNSLNSLASIQRAALLGVTMTGTDLAMFGALEELVCTAARGNDLAHACEARGITLYTQQSEGFWGQSVAEFALGLTLSALRRIPQTYQAMQTSHQVWDYSPEAGVGQPGQRGAQFGDDGRFTHGTLAGKRVRIVGAGNIASRYASWCAGMGADVAAWDPYASEPCFHRAGTKRVHHLESLMEDADIFVPMVPLMESTSGLITAEHINALPTGCLVVLVTRSGITDFEALEHRVLADELALAADVFPQEPVPLDSPLLGRHNVIHTPHNAGRTQQANEAYADALIDQFRPVRVAEMMSVS